MNENMCRVAPDGPLHLTGRIRIEPADGAVEETNEAFLCRCGASRAKPFCDDSHHGAGFADPGMIQGGRLVPDKGGDVGGTDAGDGAARTDAGGTDADAVRDGAAHARETVDAVTIACATNGPLLVRGPLTVVGEDGETSRGSKGALCRCGESATKPFCDGSHRGCGFRAE